VSTPGPDGQEAGTAVDAAVPAISVEHVSKTFPAQKALDDVSLTVGRGEVHALLGENGSGKSTLIRVLAGYHLPDPGGSVTVAGEELTLGSAAASDAAGLRFVHQHLAVIQDFNAVENMALATGYTRPAFIDWKAQAIETRRLLSLLGVEMDIWRPLSSCKPVERSAVAIARAMNTQSGDVTAVVLDEPTSSLPEPEVHQLFTLIRELTTTGIAVIYVSHRLDETFEIADRVSVLRDGIHRGTVERSELTRAGLIEMIVGRRLVDRHEVPRHVNPDQDAEVVLDVRGLTAGRLNDVSFDVRAGELVGVVGLAGSGRDELSLALTGGIPVEAGTVSVHGEALHPLSPQRALEAGVALARSNTQAGSAVKDFRVRENLTMASLPRYRGAFRSLRSRRERGDAHALIETLDIRPTDPDQLYQLLSGGNQQKVILGRCLNAKPSVLVLDEPTAGVDVGARQALYTLLARQASEGLSVLVCSSDLEDVVTTCSRVLVMRDGRVAAELTGELDERELMSIAAQDTEVPVSAAAGSEG
jgi:ribose transport system ATP-binding protein